MASRFPLPLCPREGHPRLAGTLALPPFFPLSGPRVGQRGGAAVERHGVPKTPGLNMQTAGGLSRLQGIKKLLV
jgi:hypothetical protein